MKEISILAAIVRAHKRGVKMAIEASIRTGVPLAIAKDGKIIEVKPKYKYVKVPIKSIKRKKQTVKA